MSEGASDAIAQLKTRWRGSPDPFGSAASGGVGSRTREARCGVMVLPRTTSTAKSSYTCGTDGAFFLCFL